MKDPDSLLVKQFSSNKSGRNFVIGDLHGQTKALASLMEEVIFDRGKDRLFCVGDLVDRGPKSLRALDLLKEPWFYSVVGNHDDVMIKLYRATQARRAFYPEWLMLG